MAIPRTPCGLSTGSDLINIPRSMKTSYTQSLLGEPVSHGLFCPVCVSASLYPPSSGREHQLSWHVVRLPCNKVDPHTVFLHQLSTSWPSNIPLCSVTETAASSALRLVGSTWVHTHWTHPGGALSLEMCSKTPMNVPNFRENWTLYTMIFLTHAYHD